MPIVGLFESPSKLPRSITESVLGKPPAGGAQLPVGAAAAPEKR
jgi:ubiquinol-cytochrome c reductase cytochrome b/c1 subunit